MPEPKKVSPEVKTKPADFWEDLPVIFGAILGAGILFALSLVGEKVLDWVLLWCTAHGIGIDQVRWLTQFIGKSGDARLLNAMIGLLVMIGVMIGTFPAIVYVWWLIYNLFKDMDAAKMQLSLTFLFLFALACVSAIGLVIIAILRWSWKTVFG